MTLVATVTRIWETEQKFSLN